MWGGEGEKGDLGQKAQIKAACSDCRKQVQRPARPQLTVLSLSVIPLNYIRVVCTKLLHGSGEAWCLQYLLHLDMVIVCPCFAELSGNCDCALLVELCLEDQGTSATMQILSQYCPFSEGCEVDPQASVYVLGKCLSFELISGPRGEN